MDKNGRSEGDEDDHCAVDPPPRQQLASRAHRDRSSDPAVDAESTTRVVSPTTSGTESFSIDMRSNGESGIAPAPSTPAPGVQAVDAATYQAVVVVVPQTTPMAVSCSSELGINAFNASLSTPAHGVQAAGDVAGRADGPKSVHDDRHFVSVATSPFRTTVEQGTGSHHVHGGTNTSFLVDANGERSDDDSIDESGDAMSTPATEGSGDKAPPDLADNAGMFNLSGRCDCTSVLLLSTHIFQVQR